MCANSVGIKKVLLLKYYTEVQFEASFTLMISIFVTLCSNIMTFNQIHLLNTFILYPVWKIIIATTVARCFIYLSGKMQKMILIS